MSTESTKRKLSVVSCVFEYKGEGLCLTIKIKQGYKSSASKLNVSFATMNALENMSTDEILGHAKL